MLHDHSWEPLEDRRHHHRLSMLYKIKHGIVDIDASDILRPSDRDTRGGQRLYQPYAASQVHLLPLHHPRMEQTPNCSD